MSLATADLPRDPVALHAVATACQTELATAIAELKAAKLAIQLRTLEIEKLKSQIAKLRRMQFGKSSERITRRIEQLELQLEELETGEAEATSRDEAEERPGPTRERKKPKRKPLPEHLPRQDMVHEPEDNGACICPDCGAGIGKLGEDVTEVLDYVPGHFRVIELKDLKTIRGAGKGSGWFVSYGQRGEAGTPITEPASHSLRSWR